MIDSFLDHIVYVAEHFGTDHVAIGTDCSMPCLSDKGIVWPNLRRSRPIFEQFWTPAVDPFEPTEKMNRCVAWTNWPLFTVGLVQRGFSEGRHPQNHRRKCDACNTGNPRRVFLIRNHRKLTTAGTG